VIGQHCQVSSILLSTSNIPTNNGASNIEGNAIEWTHNGMGHRFV